MTESTEKAFSLPEGREVNDTTYVRASKLADEGVNGVILEATYVESLANALNDQRLDFKFEKEDGSTVVVNGAGNLGYKMKFIEPGDYCQVHYNGKKEIQKGPQAGRMAHDFEVLTAE